MKRLLTIVLLSLSVLFVPCLQAASTRTYATLAITNTPVDGDYLVVQSSTRTWYDTVTNLTTELATTNSIVASRTNLLQHLVAYPPTGGYAIYYGVSTNDIVIAAPVDTVLTVTLATNWGTISYSTNTVQTSYSLVMPFTSQTNTWRTNMMSYVAEYLGTYSTTPLDQDATVASELVGLANTQTITGVKTFAGGLDSTNTHWISFTGDLTADGTNGILFTVNGGSTTNTHWVITSDGFGWPTIVDSGAQWATELPDHLGGILTLQMANNYFPLLVDSAHLNQWESTNQFSGVLVTNLNIISGTATNLTVQSGTLSGNVSLLTNGTWTGGTAANLTVSSGTLSGNASALTNGTWTGGTAVNLTVSSGDLSGDVTSLTNGTWTGGTALNTTLTGQATVSTNLSLTSNTLDTLVNGNNAGVILPTAFTRLTAGPTGAFSINGVAGGNDGRLVVIYNVTSQNMTIANDSGVDPVATNRIYTLTGSDYATTGSGAVTLIYDGTAARWILISARD